MIGIRTRRVAALAASVPMALSFAGTASAHEPKMYVEVSMIHATQRAAAGTLTVAGVVHNLTAGMGFVGRAREIDHYVEH